MEVHVTIRHWLLGACLLLVLMLAGWAVHVYTFDEGQCVTCYDEGMVDDGTGAKVLCPQCLSMREVYVRPDFFHLLVSRILAARRTLEDWVPEHHGFVSLASTGLLILALLRVVGCRSCGSSGLIRHPAPAFVQGSCVDCGGRGRFTVLDRLVN